MEQSDLVVIGGGPGGYAAAFHAADLGRQVTLIEDAAKLGGVCLLQGCIPSKALLHVARLINEAREAAQWGIRYEPPQIDLDALRNWKNGIVEGLSHGISQLSRSRKINVIRARASFVDSSTLHLEANGSSAPPKLLSFQQAIIATGSAPIVPEPLALKDPRIWSSNEALELREIPRRMLIVGGGYIGLELGAVYAALGSKVTLVEQEESILSGVDRDLIKPLQRRIERNFEAIYLTTRVSSIEPSSAGLLISLEGQGVPAQQLYDVMLLAVGRKPNSFSLGLERTQVKLDRQGFIKINRQQQTADPQIFAIGDVVGQPLLAHKATREGRIAAEVSVGEPSEFDNVAVPAVVFTDPEIAWWPQRNRGPASQDPD
jgi:dihydrolipoamide dehydrogenase